MAHIRLLEGSPLFVRPKFKPTLNVVTFIQIDGRKAVSTVGDVSFHNVKKPPLAVLSPQQSRIFLNKNTHQNLHARSVTIKGLHTKSSLRFPAV
jgi:hypothetical protein